MKIIEVENNKYEIIKDYKNGFDEEDFISHYTDYFEDYDYVVGDIAYSKLRLKGKGIQNVSNKKYGDMYVILNVIIPEKISREQKRIFESLDNNELEKHDAFKKYKNYLK